MLLSNVILTLFLGTLTCAIEDGTQTRLEEATRKISESLLWGAYRPNLYFGIRPRIPRSISTGLMWARVDDYSSVQNQLRHTCEQSDGMRGYGWEEFDARTGGVQKIYDEANGIDITTNFIKIANSNTGGSWATRIQGTMRNNSPPDTKTTIIFYASLDGDGHIEVDNDDDPLGFIGDVTLVGESSGLGKYQLTVRHGSGKHPKFEHEAYLTKPLDRTFVDSVIVPDRMIWQSKAILFQELKDQIDLYLGKYGKENPPAPAQMYSIPMKPGSGNVHLIQKVFEGNFEFDIILGNSSVGNDLSHAKVSDLIEKTSKDYWDEFRVIFELQPPFNVRGMQKFASILFSNLLGGLGYFYGDSVVDRSYSSEYDEENEDFWEETAAARARNHGKLEGPSELFTTVPSRSFFPRGFLWDEGFHLMPIIDWDFDLALEIYKSWYNLMDDDGWIGREQILGDEARSKVPAEFQVQYPHYANPPTLFLITDSLISKLIASNHTEPRIEKKSSISRGKSEYLKKPDLAFQYLRELYPKLRKNYFWYRKTQSGDLKSYDRTAFSSKEAYRWKGRSLQHILTSGLDDYPRPQPPHPGELHLDLISWMAMMTRSLGKFASLLGYEEDEEEFEEIGRAITRNIDDLHWSETEKCYCDATIDDYEENALVCHKGYVSIFPFLMGLLEPTSEKLGYMLDLIADPEEIWSEFGIRSLSKNSEFYGTDENYWRGPIWLNINYLVVSQLLKYAQTLGPYQLKAKEIYGQLRLNLVKTVYNSWLETGFAWEQYNAETGKGQRTQHFTGWTSLAMKIMGMPDLTGTKWTPSEDVKADRHDEL